MKVWIDILTPKQTLFFNRVAEELAKRGFTVFITVRRFRETTALYNKYIRYRYENRVVGKYGGKELKSKLLASIKRMRTLTKIIDEEKPDLAISFTSPDAARVAYGLGIKHISVSDTPHAEAASKLSIPLSIRLYTPWVIPKNRWTKYGIDGDKIFQYKGLDPITWLKHHTDDRETRKIIKKIKGRYLVIRPIEWMASYQLNTDYTKMMDVKLLINKLSKDTPDLNLVILPRYKDDISKYRDEFREYNNVYIIEKPIDGPTLLKYSVGLIGYGGTMTMESALLGKLTITVRPGKQPEYIEYLMEKKLVLRCRKLNEVMSSIKKHYETGFETVETVHIWREMEDPATYIADTIATQPPI